MQSIKDFLKDHPHLQFLSYYCSCDDRFILILMQKVGEGGDHYDPVQEEGLEVTQFVQTSIKDSDFVEDSIYSHIIQMHDEMERRRLFIKKRLEEGANIEDIEEELDAKASERWELGEEKDED